MISEGVMPSSTMSTTRFLGVNLHNSAMKKAAILAFTLITLILLYENRALLPSPSLKDSSALKSSDAESLFQPTTGNDTALATSTAIPAQAQATDLALPADYDLPIHETDWCDARFGLEYIRSFTRTHNSYCQPKKSISNMNCMFTNISDDGIADNFCVFDKVLFDPTVENHPISVDCELKDWEKETVAHKPQGMYEFREYMFETGPHFLFQEQFNFHNDSAAPMDEAKKAALNSCSSQPGSSKNFTILIKRDGTAGKHPWHSLMEPFSYFLTMDILRTTIRPETGKPYFTDADIDNAQVVILDGHDDGVFFDLWNMFAKKPALRLKDYIAQFDGPICLDNLIVPIPGSANPMWKGDWRSHDCTRSRLLDVFVERVMKNYKIEHQHQNPMGKLNVTFIDRRGHRLLKDQKPMLDKLAKAFPETNIRAVDFASISYKEQIELMSSTDVLAGVHGAGMTQAIYLPPGSSVVEIMPYDFEHRGFRNLANLRGHRYFRAHCMKGDEEGWQWVDDVEIEDEKFQLVMGAAIRSVLHRGLRDTDVGWGGRW